mgnify:FL=1
MKTGSFILTIAVAMVLSGCATKEEWSEDEKEIALSEVPAPVMTAAEGAVEGFVPEEAEVETEDGQMVYEIEGKAADGKKYEIEVSADGNVLEVEEDDEDEDDD